MCGIFGSSDLERYITLYELNKDRGNFAYGSLYTYNEQGPMVFREQVDDFLSWNVERYADCRFYMGHTQGPTSAKREFDPETSHPFQFEEWSVAHNGVLSNSKALAEEYEVENPVDSAVIPKIISIKRLDSEDEVHAIQQACNELKGTFTCWIHDEFTDETYLVRNGSTLFIDTQECEFSSAEVDGMKAAKEGIIYRVDTVNRDIHEVGNFNSHSPFFIL